MRILPFVVNGQTLDKADEESFESLIRGSTGYLKCSFTFDESWNGYTKAVEFLSTESSQYFFLNKDNTIDIPSNITSDNVAWKSKIVEIGVGKSLTNTPINKPYEG